MQRLFWYPRAVLLLLAAMAAGPGTGATAADGGQAPTPAAATNPEVIVTGKAPSDERPLPALPADEDVRCLEQKGFSADLAQAALCEHQLNWERRVVVEACINRSGTTAPRRVIQACTEALDRKIFEGSDRFFLFADRAGAYFAEGDKQRALDDYNEAVNLAPRNAEVHYDRGVFYAAQSDDDAALRDFDAAIGIDSKLIPALRQRAKIYQARSNFGGARADYSEAIGLQPKSAALWSERGYVCLRQHDYESAIRDEAEAIRLDPGLARAYFLRGAALGNLGDSSNASSDVKTAVSLEPSLARYVMIRGKTASLALPPL